ncbi:MAG: ABC transporter substrate-binding protein [Desulfobacterales bacterium]|nr:MAG: ABC transporter substrate-binding protein [Desulfobacterales bacterium]
MIKKNIAMLIVIFACLAFLAVPVGVADDALKVGAYGGYFKDSFDKHIYPDFTKETGIQIESIAEPTGEAWLVQLEQAARAGQAPADVSMMSQTVMLRGQRTDLWTPYDLNQIPNHKHLLAQSINRYPDGRVSGIGAVGWYITLVSNTNVFKTAPTSWADMWAPDKKNSLGLLALASNSFLLEITAKTFFGGYDILNSQEGILKVMNKLAELKPNVKLWYRDEGQFQQALQSGEIPMGQYYHDVAGLAAADGHPVRSTFPKEGGVYDSGSWAVSKASKKLKEAYIFIDYMCRPEIQAKLSRKVGTAPTVRRDVSGLTDAEFASVSSEITPIIPRYDIYTGDLSDWVNQKWTEMVTK